MSKAFHPTLAQIAALNAFAKAYGAFWKTRLRAMWKEDCVPTNIGVIHLAPLRQIKNAHGGVAYLAKHKVNR